MTTQENRFVHIDQVMAMASIIQTATGPRYSIEQDLKGRWHIWAEPTNGEIISYDPIARQLEEA